MKAKSASVQNFENVVEQMIDGALEKNEKMIQFHRLIFEKWYFMKLSESKSTEFKRNETKSLESNKQNISATVAHRRSRRYKYKRPSGNIKPVNERDAREHLEISQVQSFISINNKQSTATRNKKDLNESNNITFPPTAGDTKVIEIWSNSLSMKRSDQLQNAKENNSVKVRTPNRKQGLLDQQQNGEKLSFEAWKKKKTTIYRRIFKKIEIEQRQKLLKNLANMEWKKIIQQTQMRKKQQSKHQRNQKWLSSKHPEMAKQGNNEKLVIAEHTSNTSEKQKEMKLNKEKRTKSMMMRRSRGLTNDHNNKRVLIDNGMENIVFRSWLNQLNKTLHKKYLRERRHLVQSFYCQPFYYGDATFSTR